MLADRVEDDVVRLAALGEVLLRVVDHPVRSERPHELEVLGAADSGDVRAEVLGQLHPCGADRSRRPEDENRLPPRGTYRLQAHQGEDRPIGNRGSLFECHAGRHVRQRCTLRHADELRVCPRPECCGAAEDPVTNRELGDRCADCCNLSRQLGAKYPLLRPAEAEEEADEERLAFTNSAVGPGHRRGVNPDEDLVLPGYGPLDVFEALNLWRPVPVIDNCLHWIPFSVALPSTVRTTFPTFRCVSTYLVASIKSSNGSRRSITGR